VTTMFRPYTHEAFRASEHELRGAAERAARRRDARPDDGRRRIRIGVALAAGLRSIADRLDARRDTHPEATTEPASGPC